MSEKYTQLVDDWEAALERVDELEMEVEIPGVTVMDDIEGYVLECNLKDSKYYIRLEYLSITPEQRDEIVKFVYSEIDKGTSSGGGVG